MMGTSTMKKKNDISRGIFRLFFPPIYSLLCKGSRDEDRIYELIFLAMEALSLVLDVLGGSHWGYHLASVLLSFLVFQTTIDAYFIKRSRIKSEDRQHIVVQIAFPGVQFGFSLSSLIKTLSGVKTNNSLSVYPLVYAIITVIFTLFLKKKGNVSDLSSDTPPDPPPDTPSNQRDKSQVSINVDHPSLESKEKDVDPSLDSGPTSDDEIEPVSAPTSSANVRRSSTLLPPKRGQIKEAIFKSLIGQMRSMSIYVESLKSKEKGVGPSLDSNAGPLSVFAPTSSAKVPQGSTLRQRKQSQSKEAVFMDHPSSFVTQQASFHSAVEDKNLTTTRRRPTAQELFKIDTSSSTQPKQPKLNEEKQPVETKDKGKSSL